jgi:hypothetical protein
VLRDRVSMLAAAEQLHAHRLELLEAAATGQPGSLEALAAADDLAGTEMLLLQYLRKDSPMMKPTQPAAAPQQVLLVQRSLNFAGKCYPRGSVAPPELMQTRNGRALLSSGAVIWGIASETMPQPRDLPPPAPPEPPSPLVVIVPGADAVESYCKTLQRLIDAGVSYGIAVDLILGFRDNTGPAGADLHKRAHAIAAERASRLSGASYRRPFVSLTPAA